MGNRRTIAAFVAVALIVTMLGSCGSSSKSSAKAQARTAAQAKAARAQVAAAKRRLAAARARVAAQRRALAAVVRRRRLRARAAAKAAAKRAAAATSTTTIPAVSTPTTTPTAHPPGTAPPPTSVATLAADLAAIAHTVDVVNAAFAKGVAAGIAASELANYYVSAGVYSDGRCSAFEAARGLGVVADHLVVHTVDADARMDRPGAPRASPGAGLRPVDGRHPDAGRDQADPYAVGLDPRDRGPRRPGPTLLPLLRAARRGSAGVLTTSAYAWTTRTRAANVTVRR